MPKGGPSGRACETIEEAANEPVVAVVTSQVVAEREGLVTEP